MNNGEEIEEFEDEDPDFGLEDNSPVSLDEHREFVCLSCGAAFGTQDQRDVHKWSRHTK